MREAERFSRAATSECRLSAPRGLDCASAARYDDWDNEKDAPAFSLDFEKNFTEISP
jgi:hypothetical protein